MQFHNFRFALLALPALALIACGGGGDGGGPAGAPAPSGPAQVAITSANAQPVAAEALQTATNFQAAALGAGLATGVQVEATGSTAATPFALAQAARTMVARLPQRTALATGVTTTDTLACSGGGSLTLAANTANTTTVSAGDQVTIAANACVEGGTRLNGTMAITFVSGDFGNTTPLPRSVTLRIVATNFTLTQGNESSVSNGDLQVAVVENAGLTTIALNANALTSTITVNGSTHATTLKKYFHKIDASSAGTLVFISADVETSNPRLGAGAVAYQVETPATLELDAAGAFTRGSLKVTGQASGLLLTVTGPDTFALDLDANGDGTAESRSTVTRAQLQAAL